MEWSTTLHRLQHRTLASLRHFGLLLIAVNIVWLGLPALPAYATSQESWDNAWTHTTSIYAQPYKSVIYTVPQVVDVGEGFVEYNIERVKLNEYWVDCPTSSFYIKTANTEVWSVNRTEQRLSKCIWQLWAFNGSAWREIEDSESTFSIRESETSATLEHYRVMEDASLFNVSWTFGNYAKASVSFEAGEARAYAITWHVESPKATREVVEGKTITFLDESEWLSLLDYFDASMFHNQTEVSALGATGRKVRVTFANKTFLAGEQVTIDPIVDTFEGMESYDGRLWRTDPVYPCRANTTTASTGTDDLLVGQSYESSSGYYSMWRGFLSFNTTEVNATLTVERIVLHAYLVSMVNWGSQPSFDIKVYAGFYDALDVNDWEKCSGYAGILCNSLTAYSQQYYSVSMTGDSMLNKTGLTQFKLVSSRDEAEEQPSKHEYGYFKQTKGSSSDDPYLEVYYEQEEEQKETKGEGTEDGTTGGDTIGDVVSSVKQELSVRGLYWLAGGIILIVVGGVYAGTKTKKVSRKARGKTGGGGSPQPRGIPKKRSRDARGRFK